MHVSVAHLQVNFVMTGPAERHEIAALMRSALGHRKNVVHLLHQGHTTFFQTHLTQRMLGSITVADA